MQAKPFDTGKPPRIVREQAYTCQSQISENLGANSYVSKYSTNALCLDFGLPTKRGDSLIEWDRRRIARIHTKKHAAFFIPELAQSRVENAPVVTEQVAKRAAKWISRMHAHQRRWLAQQVTFRDG